MALATCSDRIWEERLWGKAMSRSVGFFVVRVLVVLFVGSLPASADIRKTIAEKFGVDPTSFVLNLPPRPGCLPGSIFTDDLRVPLSRTKLDDPDLQFGPPFHFTADISFDAGVE